MTLAQVFGFGRKIGGGAVNASAAAELWRDRKTQRFEDAKFLNRRKRREPVF
jgi:hypothetical protein